MTKTKDDYIKKLESVAKMTADEAKRELLAEMDRELTSEKARKIRSIEERIKLDAKEKAKEILADAMKNGATSYVAEFTVSSLTVPNEEVKGRIIGREGRNIRTFERETGTELEIGEGNEIRISSFDAIRREVARRALEELIKDTRIQPERIEEIVKTIKSQMDDVLLEEGKKIAEECGIFNLPVEIVKIIGRFRFRTSYGQNLAVHTIEETKMGVHIAEEIGANAETVRLGCLLHDIGKVITDEEGTHIEVGVNLLKKYGIAKEVVATVAEHHEDRPFSSIESICVWTADAISGSRPGARYEPFENYVKRLNKIEEIAGSFAGVEAVFAFQAGREVRVIVKPDEIDDDRLTVLARDIANRIEKEAEYAGQVKVTAIREVRSQATTAAK